MSQVKGLLKSGTILANLSMLIPAVDLMLAGLQQIPHEILPAPVAGLWIGVGSIIAIIRRVTAKKAISGLL